jgi:hypothetical protein
MPGEVSSIGMIMEGTQNEASIQAVSPDLLFVFNVEWVISVLHITRKCIVNMMWIEWDSITFILLQELITNKEKQIKGSRIDYRWKGQNYQSVQPSRSISVH